MSAPQFFFQHRSTKKLPLHHQGHGHLGNDESCRCNTKKTPNLKDHQGETAAFVIWVSYLPTIWTKKNWMPTADGNITNIIVRICFSFGNFWSALAHEWNLSWWNFQMILFLKVFFHPSLDFTLNRCILPENSPGWQVYKWLWPIIKLHLKPVRAPR